MTPPVEPPFWLKARLVFPVAGPPVREGAVAIAAGRIAAIERNACDADCIDLGNVAILPALVNAHAHLEFSGFDQPLGSPGMPLPQWIRLVTESRATRDVPTADCVARGLAEALAAGVAALGEIATPGWSAKALWDSPIDVTAFYELIALSPDRAAVKMAEAREHLKPSAAVRCKHRVGLSPHAPYTVRWEMFAAAVDLAVERGAPVAMHLAESPEELRLLSHGDGPFRDRLVELGVWDATAIPRGARPLDYLRRLASAPRSLVIHGNYLADDEIAFAAEHAERMTVVYCPRTHAYFGHARHPLEAFLASGAAVAIGTDSRASNPDLNLWSELKFLVETFPALDRAGALRLATAAGAAALGLSHERGALAQGMRADLCVVALPDRDTADPYNLLFDPQSRVRETWIAGERAAMAADRSP